MKSYREAIIDNDGNILPPASEVTFNSSIQSNDGLLAHSIMRRNNSTFEEARAQMSQAIEDIKVLLKSDREFTFGRIGILSLGQENNISFLFFKIIPIFYTTRNHMIYFQTRFFFYFSFNR